MPPTQTNPLTPAEYLLFTDMVTRIRTLEHIATQHFFKGDAARRADIVRRVKLRVATAHRLLFPVPVPVGPDLNLGDIGPDVGSGAVASDDVAVAGRCNFPYCPSSNGTCELCGLDGLLQQLLAMVPGR